MTNSGTNEGQAADQPWLRRFALLLCAATLVLIFLGGQVKSHEAGLSVPDWPMTYGENPITYPISKWKGGIFHEHFHRLWAGAVATLTMVLALWLTFAARRRRLKVLGWCAVGTVLLQALMGGLTVLLQLPVMVSSIHAILAQTFLLLLVFIAHGLSRGRADLATGTTRRGGPTFRGAVLIVTLIYGQLFLGALMRHTESGLAIPDFPTTGGRIIPLFNSDMLAWINDWRLDYSFDNNRGIDLPEVTLGQVAIHFSHRLGALLITCVILLLSVRARKRGAPRPVRKSFHHLNMLLGVQLVLGMCTIWTAKAPWVTSLHVVTGAGVLVLAGLLAERAWLLGESEEVSRVVTDHAHGANA